MNYSSLSLFSDELSCQRPPCFRPAYGTQMSLKLRKRETVTYYTLRIRAVYMHPLGKLYRLFLNTVTQPVMCAVDNLYLPAYRLSTQVVFSSLPACIVSFSVLSRL